VQRQCVLVSLEDESDFPVGPDPVTIGRDVTCDIRLASPRISRYHCCLIDGGAGFVVVRDLGSTNGTRVNGRLVRTGRLAPGDELSVAHIRFRVEPLYVLSPSA
jgi:pSer/pThr/pTyr-binding forkhead associated (FHA) protein